MATCAVVVYSITSLILFVFQVVAVATPGWIILEPAGKWSTYMYLGLFQVCTSSRCESFGSYVVHESFSFVAIVMLQFVGAILLLASFVNSLRFVRSIPDGQERSVVYKAAIALGVAGGCILVGVVWLAFDMENAFDVIESQNFKVGYSFVLAAVIGASNTLLAITASVAAYQMATPPPPVITTFAPAPCPQTIVVHSTTTNQAGYTYPMTSPVGLPQNDPAYGYNQ